MDLSPPKCTLLIIIDDSTFDLRINSGIAKHTHLFQKIMCFPAAREALDFLIEHIHDQQIFPHLILLDIQMPEMDGFEFIKQYDRFPQSFKKNSRVVMLSSTDDLRDIAKAETDSNIIKLLKKPLKIGELKELVHDIFPSN